MSVMLSDTLAALDRVPHGLPDTPLRGEKWGVAVLEVHYASRGAAGTPPYPERDRAGSRRCPWQEERKRRKRLKAHADGSSGPPPRRPEASHVRRARRDRWRGWSSGPRVQPPLRTAQDVQSALQGDASLVCMCRRRDQSHMRNVAGCAPWLAPRTAAQRDSLAFPPCGMPTRFATPGVPRRPTTTSCSRAPAGPSSASTR